MTFISVDPVDGLKNTISGLDKILKTLESSKIWQEMGDRLVRLISARVRTGYGVSDNNGKKTKFKPLMPSTIKARQLMKDRGDLASSITTPKKSNLTMTGDMIDALTARTQGSGVTILFSRTFANNKAEWVSVTRPFMFLTSSELKAASKYLTEAIDEALREFN